MTEHEKLMGICEVIGREYIKEDLYDENFKAYGSWLMEGGFKEIDVREIIFTSGFIDKLEAYVNKQNKTHFEILWTGMRNHLDNPTEYIYKLLELGK